ncbi:DUF2971 domain-containing protein [Shewanella gaetbuli]
MNNLINNQLSFSIGQTFNDPFDATLLFPSIFATHITLEQYIDKHFSDTINFRSQTENRHPEQIKHELKQQLSSPKGQNIILDKYRQPIQELMCNSYISCLSTSSRNPLLWAHYGDNHRGFCIRYRFDKLVDSLPLRFYGEVSYTDTPMNLLDIVSRPGIKEQVDRLLVQKSSYWEYEKEYRLILKKCRTQIQDKHSTQSFNPEAIDMVLFGLKASSENKRNLFSKLEGNSILFKEMFADRMGFDLFPDTGRYSPS